MQLVCREGRTASRRADFVKKSTNWPERGIAGRAITLDRGIRILGNGDGAASGAREKAELARIVQ
jgi:hypothetical protein